MPELALVDTKGYYCSKCDHIWYERPNRTRSTTRTAKYVRCNKCYTRSRKYINYIIAKAIQCTCGNVWHPRMTLDDNVARCNKCCRVHKLNQDMLVAYLNKITMPESLTTESSDQPTA